MRLFRTEMPTFCRANSACAVQKFCKMDAAANKMAYLYMVLFSTHPAASGWCRTSPQTWRTRCRRRFLARATPREQRRLRDTEEHARPHKGHLVSHEKRSNEVRFRLGLLFRPIFFKVIRQLRRRKQVASLVSLSVAREFAFVPSRARRDIDSRDDDTKRDDDTNAKPSLVLHRRHRLFLRRARTL